MRTNRPSIILALCAALAVAPAFAQSAGENEPNIALPAASTHYAADEVPDRIVATPAQDASTGFSVNWRGVPTSGESPATTISSKGADTAALVRQFTEKPVDASCAGVATMRSGTSSAA